MIVERKETKPTKEVKYTEKQELYMELYEFLMGMKFRKKSVDDGLVEVCYELCELGLMTIEEGCFEPLW